ncbi:MAG: 6-carboxytetrahydropterin synthase [Acidobacteriaceae bacterium]|nr:6-carboxytetrahydropterin synthase [Acidobacteriaceae bacterium]
MTSLTRRYRFSASHRLHSEALSAADNQRLYGKCNNPHGHGHDYILEVTATGRVGEANGLILSRRRLDRLVEDKILCCFANRNLNADAPDFAQLVPTTENLALVITRLLKESWADYVAGSDGACSHLSRVHIQETGRNGFEVLIPDSNSRNLSSQVEDTYAQS